MSSRRSQFEAAFSSASGPSPPLAPSLAASSRPPSLPSAHDAVPASASSASCSRRHQFEAAFSAASSTSPDATSTRSSSSAGSLPSSSSHPTRDQFEAAFKTKPDQTDEEALLHSAIQEIELQLQQTFPPPLLTKSDAPWYRDPFVMFGGGSVLVGGAVIAAGISRRGEAPMMSEGVALAAKAFGSATLLVGAVACTGVLGFRAATGIHTFEELRVWIRNEKRKEK